MKHHHIVYGELHDNITGEVMRDTDDERVRQQIQRLFLEEKGYSREDLHPRQTIVTCFSAIRVVSTITLLVQVAGTDLLIVRYAPGSLVTRQRSAVAASRLIKGGRNVPFAVLTNGREWQMLNSSSGKVVGYGVESIPDVAMAQNLLGNFVYKEPLSKEQREKEMRILNAFDRELCCR